MTAPTNALVHIESSYNLGNLRRKITILKNELVMQIASGSADDYAAYKMRVGKLQGFDEALAIIDEMEKSERN